MAELKTKKNTASVDELIAHIQDPQTRNDCYAILKLMRDVSKEEPLMWGTSIVGFGQYHYKYASGREGDWFRAGFSPRKHNLTLYVLSGKIGEAPLLKKLGKHSTGKSCLYIKSLKDVDLNVIKLYFSSEK